MVPTVRVSGSSSVPARASLPLHSTKQTKKVGLSLDAHPIADGNRGCNREIVNRLMFSQVLQPIAVYPAGRNYYTCNSKTIKSVSVSLTQKQFKRVSVMGNCGGAVGNCKSNVITLMK